MPTAKTPKHINRHKPAPVDPERALGAAGYFLKTMCQQLSERVTKLERELREQRERR